MYLLENSILIQFLFPWSCLNIRMQWQMHSTKFHCWWDSRNADTVYSGLSTVFFRRRVLTSKIDWPLSLAGIVTQPLSQDPRCSHWNSVPKEGPNQSSQSELLLQGPSRLDSTPLVAGSIVSQYWGLNNLGEDCSENVLSLPCVCI